MVVAREGGDQHDKGAAGKMEICDEAVADPVLIPGVNEDVGLAEVRLQVLRIRTAELRAALKRPYRGGADGNHPVPCPLRLGNGLRDALRDLDVLGVHVVILDAVLLHRLEGAGAHVQSHELGPDALLPDLVKQLISEMEPCGGGGDGSGDSPVDRLVVNPVRGLVAPVDVRGKGNVSVLVEHPENIVSVEAEHEEIPVTPRDLGLDAVAEYETASFLRRMRAAEVREDLALAGHPLEKHLDLPAGALGAEHPRGNYLGIVEDHQVAGLHEIEHIPEMQVLILAGVAVKLQQTAGNAILYGILRDQLMRQIEIEFIKLHCSLKGNGKTVRTSVKAGTSRKSANFNMKGRTVL